MTDPRRQGATLQWKPGETTRILNFDGVEVGTAHETVAVAVAHRRFPDYAFVFNLDQVARVVGFQVRSLDLIERRETAVLARPLGDSPELDHLVNTVTEVTWHALRRDASSSGIDITGQLLRSIPYGELRDAAVAWLQQGILGHLLAATAEAWRDVRGAQPRRLGPSGYSDLFYARVAARYASLVAAGEAQPMRRMSSEQEGVPIPTVRTQVSEARKRGLLTDAPRPGRAGGELTDKAIEILESEEGSQ